MATPAGAAVEGDDAATDTISFHHGGVALTCRVGGLSSFRFQDAGDTTVIDAVSGVYDDPGCRDALFGVTVTVRYETAPGSGSFVLSKASGVTALEDPDNPGSWGVTTHLEVPGPTGPITVTHTASFLCDENPRTATCPRTVTTSPK
jgi:hypothetical protein